MKIEIKEHTVLIDKEDYDLIKDFSWFLSKCSNTTYLFAHLKGSKPYRKISMHRLIMGVIDVSKDVEVDHKNHNGSDNRKCNLRLVNITGNKRNAIRKNQTGFTGVRKLPSGNYQSIIKINKIQKHLGTFSTPEEAHSAYKKKYNEQIEIETIKKSQLTL